MHCSERVGRGATACVLVALIGLVGCAPTTPQSATQEEATAASLESPDDFQTGIDNSLGPREAMRGASIYAAACAGCHTGQVPKAPHFIWLEMMSGQSLMHAMNEGIMRAQSEALTTSDKVAVVEYLTRTRYEPDAERSANINQCRNRDLDVAAGAAAVGWGHDNRRFVPEDVGGLSASNVSNLKLKWAFGFPDALRARSNPAIGYGAVFVGSQDGSVYALDLDSGCVKWRFKAAAEVRTGIVVSTNAGSGAPSVYFGDILAKAYALNALTGELQWERKMDDHASATLTGTPALHDGALYVPVSSLEVTSAADPAYDCCTFRGKVVKLNAADGEPLWTAYAIPQTPAVTGTTSAGAKIYSPSGAPVWASPTIDAEQGVLYFGTGENYSTPADGNSDAIIAVNLETGERLWRWQATANDAWNVACMMANNPNCPPEDGPDFDFGSSLLRIDVDGQTPRLLAGHKNGSVFSFHPANIEAGPLWTTKLGRGSIQGGVHFGMAAEGERLYVPINDMNDTRNGDVLDPALARPGVHAISARDGSVLWQAVAQDQCGKDRPFCDPGVSAAITAVPGAVIAGHLDGRIRAYDGDSGEVLWSFDSARRITTVNGVSARGGGMSGGGAAVGAGHLAVNSGYGLYFHEPGNLLLVFSAE